MGICPVTNSLKPTCYFQIHKRVQSVHRRLKSVANRFVEVVTPPDQLHVVVIWVKISEQDLPM